MKAITREEKIMSGENLTPITRKELFLAKAAGQVVETPMPITREEMFLDNIQGGSGGSTLPRQQKVVDITENGTVEVTPDYGYTLSKVTANVNVEGNVEVFAATSDVDIFIVSAEGIDTLRDVVSLQGGNLAIQIVQTLPEKLIVSEVSGYVYAYVVESTGIAYADLGYGIMSAGMFLLSNDAFNKGWATDINSVTEHGVYCVRKPTAYNVKSIDELPSNAVDGSLALVGDDGFLGTWRLHPNVSPAAFEHLAAPDAYHEFYFDFSLLTVGVDGTEIVHCKYLYIQYADNGLIEGIGGADDDEGIDIEIYHSVNRVSTVDAIIFETMPEPEEIETFVRANGTKTKSLYIHENGEWVYNGEVA